MPLLQIFKSAPTDEIISMALQVTGFETLDSNKIIQREHINTVEVISQFKLIQPLISNFYLPCKAKIFIKEEPDAKNIITILRHLVKLHGYGIQTHEKVKFKTKVIYYQIYYKESKLSNIPKKKYKIKHSPEKKLTIKFD